MLGSPLRLCSFHRRIFPSKLLLRFGVGWHPATNQPWAYPTVGKRHEYSGKGYYISLSQDIVEWVKNGFHKSIFRQKDNVIYRTDMSNHVKTELVEEAYKAFCKYPLNRLTLLTSMPESSSDMEEYQCILLLASSSFSKPPQSPSLLSFHESKGGEKHIPVYDVSFIWSHHELESRFRENNTIALGVPRDEASVDLAVCLWRCHLYLKKTKLSKK
ncbi:hypothetical protein K501DRAFT_253076 [Backusella circina FSU 941]|nr:hypothetical protein K501DRAFT_253076 [Backusella circina FSU 941]